MSPQFPASPSIDRPHHLADVNFSTTYSISISRTDRWRIYHRLQELMIPCWCLEDGSLRAEVQNSLGALLLRSVVQQFVAPRQEMINWLERCWHTELPQ
jgi:hypothetical protein